MSFIGRIDKVPILFLGTARPSYVPSWFGQTTATHLILPPLTKHDSQALIRSVSRGGLAESLTNDLIEKAEGNPFFLEELTRSTERRPITEDVAPIPDTVQAVLAARIDRLRPEIKPPFADLLGDRRHHSTFASSCGLGAR